MEWIIGGAVLAGLLVMFAGRMIGEAEDLQAMPDEDLRAEVETALGFCERNSIYYDDLARREAHS